MITPASLLKRKHLLLDTGVLIELQKNEGASEELKEFLQDILQAPCALLTIDQVYCEFLQYAEDKQGYLDLLTWAKKLAPAIYPSKEDQYVANQIYLAFKNKNKDLARNASSTDLLLGAMLARYGDALFLATTNHKDFPTCLYDRDYVFSFENREGNIQNICIIKFNQAKFSEWLKQYA